MVALPFFRSLCRPSCPRSTTAQKEFLSQKKRTAKDVYGTGLLGEEAVVLRASLIEYLAYSGRTAKFLPFLLGFRPTENVAEPNTDMALNAANLAPAQLSLKSGTNGSRP